jgi:thioredoxin reductase (NADPH)
MESLTLRDAVSGRTETVPAAALFVLIGAEPHTSWFPAAVRRDDWGYVLTGPDLPEGSWPLARSPLMFETSLPGVFAVGDAREGSTKRVASAVGEGSVVIEQVHNLFHTGLSGVEA